MKNISWLNNFAEEFAKSHEIKKTASVKKCEDIIVDKEDVNAKLGEVINFNGKLYKIADLNYEDEKGPGVVLTEMDQPEQPIDTPVDTTIPVDDPMAMAMGTTDIPADSGKSQEYARTNPGDVYDNAGIAQEEINKFNSEAQETAANIEKERNFDRSTVPGHYTAPKDMAGTVAMDPIAIEQPIEQPIDETIPEIDEEIPTEENVEDKSEDIEEEVSIEKPEELDKVEDEIVEDEEEDDKEEKPFAEMASLANFKNNRILRRIMSSK